MFDTTIYLYPPRKKTEEYFEDDWYVWKKIDNRGTKRKTAKDYLPSLIKDNTDSKKMGWW